MSEPAQNEAEFDQMAELRIELSWDAQEEELSSFIRCNKDELMKEFCDDIYSDEFRAHAREVFKRGQ